MSETFWTSVVVAVQAVTLALLGLQSKQLGNVKRDARATKEQVVNDHSTNLREEQDRRHRETQRALAWIGQRMGWLTDMAIGNRSRIRDLENTRPPTRRSIREQNQPDWEGQAPFIRESDIPGRMPWDDH